MHISCDFADLRSVGRDQSLPHMQVLHHVAQRLLAMHKAGWAHLDLKPGSVLRRPQKHSWTLIDFGCTCEIGARSCKVLSSGVVADVMKVAGSSLLSHADIEVQH